MKYIVSSHHMKYIAILSFSHYIIKLLHFHIITLSHHHITTLFQVVGMSDDELNDYILDRMYDPVYVPLVHSSR